MKFLLHIDEYLNESSFFDFDVEDILTDKFIKYSLKYDGMIDTYLEWFITEHDLDEDEVNSNSLEFLNYIKNEYEDRFETVKEEIYDKIDYDTNKLTIYRAITVDDNWFQHLNTQGKRLGIYWTYNENSAETHWGDFKKTNTAIIEVEIDEKYIDWKTTFELNVNLSTGDEDEIRLYKNTKLTIKSIKINDEYVDISNIRNKTFLS
jgi:hypothetical protein